MYVQNYDFSMVQDKIHFVFQLCLCRWGRGIRQMLMKGVKNRQNLAYVVYGWPIDTRAILKKVSRQYVKYFFKMSSSSST